MPVLVVYSTFEKVLPNVFYKSWISSLQSLCNRFIFLNIHLWKKKLSWQANEMCVIMIFQFERKKSLVTSIWFFQLFKKWQD